MAANKQQNEWVVRVLGIEPASPAPEGAAVRMAQGLLLWNGKRAEIGQQMKTLKAAILAESAGEDDAQEIADSVDQLDEVLETLDDRLTVKLNALRGTTDPAAKRKITGEARAVIGDYQAYIDADELVAAIERNGFVDVSIRAPVAATLADILKTI